MRRKNFKKSINKPEELPGFLLNLKGIPEDVDLPLRSKKSDNYLGPIFFGECLKYHPPHSSVPLGSFHHMQIFGPSEENILKDVFLPKSVIEEKFLESKTYHPVIRSKKIFDDPFPHKCPGVRKVFAPLSSLTEGLGETKSIIEGETSREIPFCRFKKISDSCNPEISKTEVEVVTLSDIREEKRKLMSEKERRAHAHFPKEFVTLRIIGPTIPESIIITKLPSKRQSQYEVDLNLKSKNTKTSGKKADKGKESPKEAVASDTKKEEEEPKESIHSLLMKKELSIEERVDSDNIRQQSEEFEEESGSTKSQIIKDKEEEGEREEEWEGEFSEKAKQREQEQEKSQVFADEEKEGTSGDAEDDDHHETAED